ncbi:demethoxyubiquinone hydroxylase family protein [bacterium]|nr:demethoxyubiquinone hydroxylase family protein [bacterium]
MSQLPPQPGDADGKEYLHRMMRVNQAGEYGAVRIYKGQLAALRRRKDPESRKAVKLIEQMLEQERMHLDYFNKALPAQRIRPTALQPLWHVGGFLLGAATAALGPKAAMACTVAVEEVIGQHYGEQLEKMDAASPELKQQLAKFQADELEHHDTGLEEGAQGAVAYPVLHGVVSAITNLAIRASRRL